MRWTFLESGADLHTMKFTPGDVLTDAHWQAPPWCFTNETCRSDSEKPCAPSILDHPIATGKLLRAPRGPTPSRASALAAERLTNTEGGRAQGAQRAEGLAERVARGIERVREAALAPFAAGAGGH